MKFEPGQHVRIDGKAARATFARTVGLERRRRRWDAAAPDPLDEIRPEGWLVWDEDNALLRSLTYLSEPDIDAIVLDVRVPHGKSQRRTGVRIRVIDRPARWRRHDFGDGTYLEGYVRRDENDDGDFIARDEFRYEIVVAAASLAAQHEKRVEQEVRRGIWRMEHGGLDDDDNGSDI